MPRKITKKIIGDIYDLRTPLEIKTEGNTYVYNKNSSLSKWLTFTEDISSSGTATEIIDGLSFTASGTKQPDFVTNDLPAKLSELSTVSLNSAYGFQTASSNTTLTLQDPAYESRFDFGTVTSPANNAFTFAAWVNFSIISDQVIASKWHNTDTALQQYELLLNGSSRSLKFRIYHPGGSGLGAGVYSIQTDAGIIGATNEWFHIVMTFEGDASKPNAFKFYLNGELKSTITERLQLGMTVWTLSYLPNTIAPFSIGNDHQHGANEFIGKIADFAAWTTALSSEDIYTLYNYISTEQNETIFRSGYVNLPPRIEIRNRDNATGSYPTVLRMGDKDRKGSYSTQFDDTNTIFFGRRIRDNFELRDEDKTGGFLGFSKKINSNLWSYTEDLEIRKELIVGPGGSTAQDDALVLAGAGDSQGRWIQTKNKIKNPTLTADIIFGPYNVRRTALKFGLGLNDPGASEDRGLKIQFSTDGSSWTTLKTLTGDTDILFGSSSFSSFEDFKVLLQKRKRVKIKMTPSDFSSVGSSEFYLRFIQTTVSSANQAEWAIGYINIDYHNEEVRYPIMIDPTSRVGQKVVSGAIATPHNLPTITAPGRSISGISDVHMKFTPGEDVSPFNDARIKIIPEDFFIQQGSDPNIISGMSAPLWSKTQFVVDLSPNEETTFGLNTPSLTRVSSSLETDPDIKQQLMVYWNNSLKRWEKIAQGVSGNPARESLKSMIASGAVGFSGIDMVSKGDTASYADQNIVSSDVLNSYVRPTSTFGFPFEGKYHATSSQYIKASDLGITKPFVLEKCQISFDAKFEFGQDGPISEDAYSLLYNYTSPGTRTVDSLQRIYIPTFFILKQQDYDNFSLDIDYELDFNAVLSSYSRNISIPNSSVKLSTNNVTSSYVETSRELLTYGQITLFASSSLGDKKFEIRDLLDNGLSRDGEVNILQLNGHTGSLGDREDMSSLTGSFSFNFPCRTTGKIDGGSRLRVKEDISGYLQGLWLDNKLGGRSYANLDASARSIVNGTPSLKKAGSYETFYTAGSSANYLKIKIATADSADIFSPYVIMPEDNIVFGWQYPITNMLYDRSPGTDVQKFHSMTLFENSKLTLFGCQLKESKEFHETINQNLGSSVIHEVIGAETVVDQFELSRAIENKGNYLDNFVAVSSEEPTVRLGANVQSRLITPKGQAGSAEGRIVIQESNIMGTPTDGGINDGDLIILKDHLGQYGFFFFFTDYKYGPELGGYKFPSDAWVDNSASGETFGSTSYVSLDTVQIDYNNATTGQNWHDIFEDAAGDNSINSWLHSQDSGAGWGGSGPVYALPASAYSVNIWNDADSKDDARRTLERLAEAINASHLDIIANTVVETNEWTYGPSDPIPVLDWTAKLYLTQGASGTSGNTPIYLVDANEIDTGFTKTFQSFSKRTFEGGSNLLDSSLGSFTRASPTQDGTRIYSDSLLASSSIGYPNSSFGTMQTEESPLRPKYYLDSRKYGQAIHFLEQAKDSKTIQNIKTKRSGLLSSLKGGALQSPVFINFVSGSVANSTGVQTYRTVNATTSSVFNKTINSVLTGAFYDLV